MDFNASPADGIVATMLVYVATLQLTCVFRLCRNISDFNPLESML